MQVVKLMPSLSNVSAGSTATLDAPVGRTYERITFGYAGVTLAQLKNIKVIVDGKTIQEYPSGQILADLNKFYGQVDAAGFLTLHFVRPEMANLAQRRYTALGTGDKDPSVMIGRVQTLQITMDIDSGAASPVITATAIQSEPTRFGQVLKVKQFPTSSAVAGQIEIDKIVKGPTMRAIHVIDTDATNDTKPTKLEIEMDSVKVFEASAALNEEILKQHGRTPVAGYYHAEFTAQGDYGHALMTNKAQDLRIRPTLGASGSINVLVEYVDGWKGI